MAICLDKQTRDKLKTALKSKELSIEDLYTSTSGERAIKFSKYIDEPTHIEAVNAKFEQAMLSNQKKALSNWVEKTLSYSEPVKRSIKRKIERMENVIEATDETGFLKSLTEQKLGMAVTEEEATALLQMSKHIDEAKTKWDKNKEIIDTDKNPRDKNAGWESEQARLEHGWALENFKKFAGDLKVEANSLSLVERFKPTNWWRDIVDMAGFTKSMAATFDNSFLGRQGIKVLYTSPKVWADTAIESFKLFGRELVEKNPGMFKSRNDAVMASIRADVFSRNNAMNGKYVAAKNEYGLGVTAEEAFPSSIPERIPLLGRIFKASETAFNGSALKMRADLADAVIANAEKNGVDMLDSAQATAHGKLVSAMTGRGEIGKLASIGSELNVLMFSVRFFKSNIDTLTAHTFDKTMTPQARKLAAKNLLRIAGSIAGVLTVSKTLDPDSVDFDPRGTKFGKICKGDRCFDITGGMASLVTLGSRMVSIHNGEIGSWSKSSSTGKLTKTEGKFGETTALDRIEQFFEGKLSPSAGVVRDILRQQTFEGTKPTFVDTSIGLITPISVEMFMEEMKTGNDGILVAMIAEGLGLSPSSYNVGGFGKKWEALKEKEDPKEYNKAIKTVTKKYNERADKLKKSSGWDKMDNEEQNKALDKIRSEETTNIFRKYGI